MPAESRPTPAERRKMWVEKEVFCEQNQHRGREEEVFRGCTEPPGVVGATSRHGGGPCSRGGTLLRAACSWDFGGRGLSVCLHPPVSGSPSDSWPHCASPKTFSDLRPKSCRGAGVLQMGQKKSSSREEMKSGLDLSLLGCVCVVFSSPWGGLYLGGWQGGFSISWTWTQKAFQCG